LEAVTLFGWLVRGPGEGGRRGGGDWEVRGRGKEGHGVKGEGFGGTGGEREEGKGGKGERIGLK
jgi:hypothetical protein